MANNRRPQNSKAAKSKRTTFDRPEKRIKGAPVSRNPKHRNKGFDF